MLIRLFRSLGFKDARDAGLSIGEARGGVVDVKPVAAAVLIEHGLAEPAEDDRETILHADPIINLEADPPRRRVGRPTNLERYGS